MYVLVCRQRSLHVGRGSANACTSKFCTTVSPSKRSASRDGSFARNLKNLNTRLVVGTPLLQASSGISVELYTVSSPLRATFARLAYKTVSSIHVDPSRSRKSKGRSGTGTSAQQSSLTKNPKQ